jgi:hypothetical protein
MYREISDLGLFVQTSPYGLGLYKTDLVRYFSVQTTRSVNKKLIIRQCIAGVEMGDCMSLFDLRVLVDLCKRYSHQKKFR